jgi:hypothetical protein
MKIWEYLDRVGERRSQLKLARTGNARLLANVIGCSLVFGFLGALFALFVIPIPRGNEQIVTYMIGQLSGFAAGIVAYHYTSKAGEKELEAQRADNDAKRADNTANLVDLASKALDAAPAANGGETPEAAADRVAGAAEEEAGRTGGGQ